MVFALMGSIDRWRHKKRHGAVSQPRDQTDDIVFITAVTTSSASSTHPL